MPDIVVECHCGCNNITAFTDYIISEQSRDDCIDWHFPKKIRWSSEQYGIYARCMEEFLHYINLIHKYNAKIMYGRYFCYLYIDNIKFSANAAVYEIDHCGFNDNGKLLVDSKNYNDVYKYLDDNSYGQMIRLKFVD